MAGNHGLQINAFNIKGAYRFAGQARIMDDGSYYNTPYDGASNCTFAIMWSGSPGNIILCQSHNDDGFSAGSVSPLSNSVFVFKSSSAIQVITSVKDRKSVV